MFHSFLLPKLREMSPLNITQHGDYTSVAPGKLNCQNFIIVPRRHWVNKSGGYRILPGSEGKEGETGGRGRNPDSKKELLQKSEILATLYNGGEANGRDFWNVRRARVSLPPPRP